MTMRVQLVQINNNFEKQYYLPYSAGILVAYAKQFNNISDNFSFPPPIYKRDDPESIVEQIGEVDILAVSSYIWNWWLSAEIGRQVRKNNPNAIIIYGGPHVPNNDDEFFKRNSFIDFAAHGEGEGVFHDILTALIPKKSPLDVGLDMSKIPSTSFHDRKTGEVHLNIMRPRLGSLSEIPSPYLTGYFEEIMQAHDAEWTALWETNRGCPFKCAFCDWGSATNSKVVEMEMDRLTQEIGWFADHKIKFVFGCDANFGIRPRDMDLARAFVKSKIDRGYPQDFKVCFTKNTTDKIFDIAKIFYEADIQRGVSISMQSLHEETLKAVKRDNIKLEVFEELQKRYKKAKIPTYTEIILALPEETYDSFVTGLDTLLARGQHNQIIIYNCTVMPNAELGNPEYRKQYGIKTAEVPIFVAHSSPAENDPVVEREPVVVETSTMNTKNWKKTYEFAAILQCFHCLGLSQQISIFLYYHRDIKYKDFYESLIRFAHDNGGYIKEEMNALSTLLNRVMDGKGFDQYLCEYSNITWPPEEAAFLRLYKNLDEVFMELSEFLHQFIDLEESLHADLIEYQRAILPHWDDEGDLVLEMKHNIPDYINGMLKGDPIDFISESSSYLVSRRKLEDKAEFAREIVWYGRKKGKTYSPIDRITGS